MALENLTGPNVFISNLVQTNPTTTDPIAEGDDHVRGIKNVLLNTFPNLTGAVTLTQGQLNALLNPVLQVPIGGVIDFSAASVPDDYLLVPTAQTNISRVTYAELFAVIGTQWGAGDGVNTFGMPWVPDGMPTLNAAAVNSQRAGNMPAHTHSYTAPAFGVGTGSTPNYFSSSSAAATTGSAGSGTNNMPAGMTFRKIIRYQ